MAKTALIIGGTKGLGLSLAWESHRRGIESIIAGRSAGDQDTLEKFPPGADRLVLDLANSNNLANSSSVESIIFRLFGSVDYVFWVAGRLSRTPLRKMPLETVSAMTAINWSGPVRALQLIHQKLVGANCPYHLVTIASTSSWRMRNDETLYCALKAAQAAFTRNFARELVRDLPGSKVTLVNPGGIKTGLFKDTDQDVSKFMEPDDVARIIWNEVEAQELPFDEVQIMRNEDGSPNVSYGPRLPELPFGEIIIPEDLKDKGILSEEQSNRIREALGFEGDL